MTTSLGLLSLSPPASRETELSAEETVIEKQLRLVITTFFNISKEPLISVEGQA